MRISSFVRLLALGATVALSPLACSSKPTPPPSPPRPPMGAKISEEPVATSISDADVFVGNQGGTTKTFSRSLVLSGPAASSVSDSDTVVGTQGGATKSFTRAQLLSNIGTSGISFANSAFALTPTGQTYTPAALTQPAGYVISQLTGTYNPQTVAASGVQSASLSTAPAWSTDVPSQVSGLTHSLLFTQHYSSSQRVSRVPPGGASAYTLSMWVKPAANLGTNANSHNYSTDSSSKPNGSVTYVAALACGGEVAATSLGLTDNGNGTYGICTSINGFGGMFTAGSVSPNVWTHVAVTLDNTGSGTIKLYVNGAVVGTLTPTQKPSVAQATQLGSSTDSFALSPGYAGGASATPYGGGMADVREWRGTTLSDSDVAVLAGGGTPSTSPTLRFAFSEGTGTYTADTGTLNSPGYLSSSPTWSTDVPAAFGSGYSLAFTDGNPITGNTAASTTQRLGFPSANQLGNTVGTCGPVSTWTFSGWVKFNGTNTYQTIASSWLGTTGIFVKKTGGTYNLDLVYGTLNNYSEADGSGGSVSDHLSATALSAATWYHFAVTYNLGTFTMYVNGAADSNVYTAAPELYFGGLGRGNVFGNPFLGEGNPYSGQEGLNGNLKDVRFYYSALSPANITTLAAAGDVAGAVLHLPLNDGSGTAPTNTGSNVYLRGATVTIAGPAAAGTNVTLLQPLALHVQDGQSRFGGSVLIDGSGPKSAPTGFARLNLGSGGFGGIASTYPWAATAYSPTDGLFGVFPLFDGLSATTITNQSFSGNAAGNGCSLGVNEKVGYAGSLADMQIGGVSAFKVDATGQTTLAGQANGQSVTVKCLTELTTIAASATTDTALQIPAGSLVLAVPVRVVTVIPTAATFTVTGATSGTTFDTAAVSTAANSTDGGTVAGVYYNASAQKVRITPNQTPAANTGQVRVTVFYWSVTPPTS